MSIPPKLKTAKAREAILQELNIQSNGTIVLADTHWYGHHSTYFIAMCEALLARGYRVLAICPEPEECHGKLEANWQGGAPLEERIAFDKIIHGRCFLPGKDHDPISTVMRWNRVVKSIRSLENETGWTADFVFFPKLESFLRFGFTPRLPNLLGIPWSGLYFLNYHLISDFRLFAGVRHLLKGDQLLRHSGCHVVAQLDDRPAEIMLNAFDVSPILFPDITDETIPDEPSALSLEFEKLAGGRTIFGLISMEPRKGVMELLKAAKEASDRDLFFVFTGPFDRDWFSSSDLQLIDQLKEGIASGEINHIHLNTSGDRIPDGADYNSLVQTFDVLLSVYPDYQCSSNALTKAAVFQKLVLAANGGCIGKRVIDFELGICIDPTNTQEIIEAFEELARGHNLDGKPLSPRHAEYHALHSHEQLEEQMEQVFLASTSPQATLSNLSRDPVSQTA